jgi:hypothetical protein
MSTIKEDGVGINFTPYNTTALSAYEEYTRVPSHEANYYEDPTNPPHM